MASRALLSKFVANSNLLKNPILSTQRIQYGREIQRRNTGTIRPLNAAFNPCPHSLFCIAKIKKYYEVIPIILWVIMDIVGQTCLITHNCLTRDDVRWTTRSPMNSEIVQMDRKKKVWFRKVMSVGEKISQPDGPIEAWEGSGYCEKNKTFVSSPFNEKLFKKKEEPPAEDVKPEVGADKGGKKPTNVSQKGKRAGSNKAASSKSEYNAKPKELVGVPKVQKPKEISEKTSLTEEKEVKELSQKKSSKDGKTVKEAAARKV